MNIVASRGIFISFRLAGLAFDYQEQSCKPPQLGQAEIFYPLHKQGIFIARSWMSGVRTKRPDLLSTADCPVLPAP